MVNQNIIVASRAKDAINGFAELRVLRVERVIRFRFGARESHSVLHSNCRARSVLLRGEKPQFTGEIASSGIRIREAPAEEDRFRKRRKDFRREGRADSPAPKEQNPAAGSI